eukprot:gene11717-14342_t
MQRIFLYNLKNVQSLLIRSSPTPFYHIQSSSTKYHFTTSSSSTTFNDNNEYKDNDDIQDVKQQQTSQGKGDLLWNLDEKQVFGKARKKKEKQLTKDEEKDTIPENISLLMGDSFDKLRNEIIEDLENGNIEQSFNKLTNFMDLVDLERDMKWILGFYQKILQTYLEKEYSEESLRKVVKSIISKCRDYEAAALYFYNSILETPVIPNIFLDELKSCKIVPVDKFTSALILLYLKNDLYREALEWYSDRIMVYKVLFRNYEVSQLFRSYHNKRTMVKNTANLNKDEIQREKRLATYWISPHIQDEQQHFHNIHPFYNRMPSTNTILNNIASSINNGEEHEEIDFKSITNDRIDQRDEVLSELSNSDDTTAEQVLNYLKEHYISKNIFPPGSQLVEAYRRIVHFDKSNQFYNHLSPKFIAPLLHHVLLHNIHFTVDKGLQQYGKYYDHLAPLSMGFWKSLLQGLIYGNHLSSANILFNQMLIHFDLSTDNEEFLSMVNDHVQIDEPTYQKIKSITNKHSSSMGNTLLSHLIRSENYVGALEYFQSLENPDRKTIQFASQIYANLYPIPPYNNITKWKDLEFICHKFRIPKKYYVQSLVEYLNVKAPELIIPLLKKQIITPDNLTSNALSIVIKLTKDDKTKLDIFKRSVDIISYDRELVDEMKQVSERLLDKRVIETLKDAKIRLPPSKNTNDIPLSQDSQLIFNSILAKVRPLKTSKKKKSIFQDNK